MSDGEEQPQTRRFEPPPWEREQFDELARRRAEAQAAEEERLADERAIAAAERERAARESASPAVPAAAEAPVPTVKATAPAPDERIDPQKVEAMLVQLSGEEGSALQPVHRASKVFALVVAVFGVSLVMLAGLAAAKAGGGVGAMGALIVGIVGAFITSVAAWLWIRTERGQGS